MPAPATPLEAEIIKQGLRRDWIARRMGVSGAAVTRWAAGERMPSEDDRERLALLLRRTADELFPDGVSDAKHRNGRGR